jgi:hypothetical protein
MPLNFDTREVIIEKLPDNIASLHGWTHRLRVNYTQISAAALTKMLSFALPAGAVVQNVAHACIVPFVGPSVTSLKVAVGNDAQSDNYLDDVEMVSGSVAADSFVASNASVGGADTLDVLFTAIGANLSVLTAGEVVLLFRIASIRQFCVE